MLPCLYAPFTFVCPHTFVCPQGCTLPICPHTLLCICVFLQALHVVGVVMGSPLCWDTSLTPPLFGGASPSLTPPHSVVGSLCIGMFQGYQYVMWAFSLLLKGVRVFSHQMGGLGASALEMSICSFLYIFLVHYVSHFDYSSDYHSFGYSGIFWPVISDRGSFPDRVSSKLGSAWHGSTTTLDAKRLWRCSWLSFCATAANPIFNASFSLCQLCYGFSTDRFLFHS